MMKSGFEIEWKKIRIVVVFYLAVSYFQKRLDC